MLKNFLLKRNDIRKYMRNLRNSISKKQQLESSTKLTKLLVNYTSLIKANNIASFLSVDGEIDTNLATYIFLQKRKNIFLPILDPCKPHNLLFIKYELETNLILNKFNIPEPEFNAKNLINLENIDVMLVPLVAFDISGQRLGFGGGFYDRILKYWEKYSFLPIGLAYDFQLTKEIPKKKWDIPLPIIITPSKIWKCY
ncbi:5-formyltetrahydrofolate cyclo-ligase [Pantoea sp. SoEX]|uniref:5-formyltetrahydrofolate cyclo-ligase n=1 Tax=Pantoea sp. SoEX TaxID=2576763 RepID=UPI001358D80E|nr:5-formyltetrahydrofolate cyclo-ligase [Pantoea sp. SoEX]MXP51206.1 5-formyltetrahydrofolate cyclo-ligase [Pantoea sp. SoEX]